MSERDLDYLEATRNGKADIIASDDVSSIDKYHARMAYEKAVYRIEELKGQGSFFSLAEAGLYQVSKQQNRGGNYVGE